MERSRLGVKTLNIKSKFDRKAYSKKEKKLQCYFIKKGKKSDLQ